nr:ArdC-like ssDNA-binding domain-containing protein [Phocaeicola sartorii]
MQNDWKKPWFTEGTLSWPKNLSGREYNGMLFT